MLAFLESTMAQSQANDSECASFDQRIGSLVKGSPEKSSSPGASGAASKMASVLLELVNIAAQLARVDQMIAQVKEGAPDTDEAKRWHEISLQALQCSRDMLSKKQAEFAASATLSDSQVPEEEEPEFECTPLSSPPGLSLPEATSWMGWSKEAIAACPEFVPVVQAPEESGGSLRRDLERLRERNPERVIIVRKIKKLGFESPALLEEHFQQYGQVAEVLVAHSHVKPTAKRPNGRVRPAALGFVVMESEEAAQRAVAAGATPVIGGVAIEMSSFEAFECLGAIDGEGEQ